MNTLLSVETLVMNGNKCCREDSMETRVRLLSGMQRSRRPGFRLLAINGSEVTIDDRCLGMERAGVAPRAIAKARLHLVLEQVRTTARARARACVCVWLNCRIPSLPACCRGT